MRAIEISPLSGDPPARGGFVCGESAACPEVSMGIEPLQVYLLPELRW
jgi:hypothetical protein